MTIIKNRAGTTWKSSSGQKVDHYKASGEIGEGQGKAGVAYQLRDGSMVYVPEAGRHTDGPGDLAPVADEPLFSSLSHETGSEHLERFSGRR